MTRAGGCRASASMGAAIGNAGTAAGVAPMRTPVGVSLSLSLYLSFAHTHTLTLGSLATNYHTDHTTKADFCMLPGLPEQRPQTKTTSTYSCTHTHTG